MKKTYISPSITCIRISANTMLCQSIISTETTDDPVVADSREMLDEGNAGGRGAWDAW